MTTKNTRASKKSTSPRASKSKKGLGQLVADAIAGANASVEKSKKRASATTPATEAKVEKLTAKDAKKAARSAKGATATTIAAPVLAKVEPVKLDAKKLTKAIGAPNLAGQKVREQLCAALGIDANAPATRRLRTSMIVKAIMTRGSIPDGIVLPASATREKKERAPRGPSQRDVIEALLLKKGAKGATVEELSAALQEHSPKLAGRDWTTQLLHSRVYYLLGRMRRGLLPFAGKSIEKADDRYVAKA
jgi:hypothetical protein